jgi:hypothetical protein
MAPAGALAQEAVEKEQGLDGRVVGGLGVGGAELACLRARRGGARGKRARKHGRKHGRGAAGAR